MLKITCKNCNSNYDLSEKLIGKKIKCSKCENILEIKLAEQVIFGNDLKINTDNQLENEIEIKNGEKVETILEKKEINTENKIENTITNQSKKSNKIKIRLALVLLFGFSFGGYAFYKNNIGVNLNSASENQINYLFNIKGNFTQTSKGKVRGSGSIEILDGQILSENKGLNQKFSIGKIISNIFINGKQTSFEAKKLDIISDNEKVYIYVEQGIKKLKGLGLNNSLFDDFEKSFKENKYVLMNNSKPIFELLGDLGKNEIINQLVLGATTSNPNQYYIQNGVYEKLQKALESDKILDYLFIEGEKDNTTGKTPLKLNTNICKDYGPVVLGLLNQISGKLPINFKDYTPEKIIEECESNISILNKGIFKALQIYKTGDKLTGDFKLFIISGNIIDINIDYKSHNVNTWNISVKNTEGTLILNAKKDDKKILTSEIKINYDYNGVKITGNIIDGIGTIDIKGNKKDKLISYDILGSIIISDYSISNYDFNIKYTKGTEDYKLIASGSLEKGNIDIVVTSGGVQKAKLLLNYDGSTYYLDLDSDQITLKSNYKDELFNLNLKSKSLLGRNSELTIDFKYDHGKITGKIKSGSNLDVIITGEYKSIKDFRINIIENISKYSLKFEANTNGLSELDYILYIENDKNKLIDVTMNIKKSKEKDFDIYDIVLDIVSHINENKVSGVTLDNDAFRIRDIYMLQTGLEQFYQDTGEYPTKENFEIEIKKYIQSIPKDPIGNIEKNNCKFGYLYEVGSDKNGIKNQKYRLSTCLDNENNIANNQKNDGGISDILYEKGVDINTNDFKEKFYINGYTSWTKEIDNLKDKKIDIENINQDEFKADFKIGIKNGGVQFEIPTNFYEHDIKLNELFIIPSLEKTLYTEIKKKDVMIFGASTMAVGGTVAYFSLQGYSTDARNSKKMSDISNIQSAISIKLIEGTPIESFVIRNEKYEGKNVYIGGKKLIPGIDYFVGTLNYNVLKISKQYFLDPNGDEYIIGVSKVKGGIFQILTFMEVNNTLQARINGNFQSQNKLILKETIDFQITGDNIITLINESAIGRIKQGDYINGIEVSSISHDGKTIKLSKTFKSKLILINKDSDGLIFIEGEPVINNQ